MLAFNLFAILVLFQPVISIDVTQEEGQSNLFGIGKIGDGKKYCDVMLLFCFLTNKILYSNSTRKDTTAHSYNGR